MKISNEEKRQNALKIYTLIDNCETEDDIDRVNDIIDESMLGGRIFKKTYKFLSEELDDRLMTLVEAGLV